MPAGHPSAESLKQARWDCYDYFMGYKSPPFDRIRGSANKDLLNAFLQGNVDKMREFMAQKFWTHQEQGSPGYVGQIWLEVVLASWRVYPELRDEAQEWLNGWLYLTEKFMAQKRYDIAMPASRSFVSFTPWIDAYRVLMGWRQRRRMSLRRQRKKNVPTHLAIEVARDLEAEGDGPELLHVEPRLKWPITLVTLRTAGGRIKTIAWSENRSFDDDIMVGVDEGTRRADSVQRYGYKGVVKGPGRTYVKDYSDDAWPHVEWHRGNKGGVVDYPRGVEISREVIGG